MNTIQYNITLLQSVNTLIAPGSYAKHVQTERHQYYQTRFCLGFIRWYEPAWIILIFDPKWRLICLRICRPPPIWVGYCEVDGGRLPNVAAEMVWLFVWLTMALSRSFKEHRRSLALNFTPLSSRWSIMSLALCTQIVSQAPQHFNQATCDG